MLTGRRWRHGFLGLVMTKGVAVTLAVVSLLLFAVVACSDSDDKKTATVDTEPAVSDVESAGDCQASGHRGGPSVTPPPKATRASVFPAVVDEGEPLNTATDSSVEASSHCSPPDPCNPRSVRDVSQYDIFSSMHQRGGAFEHGETLDVETLLEEGLHGADVSPTHLVLRGTAQDVRCEWRGVARTLAQREEAIRFWLHLDESDSLPSASDVETYFNEILDAINPTYPETTKATFQALARGSLSTDIVFLTCFADIDANPSNGYIVGTGPASLTVAYDTMGEGKSYDLYARAHEAG